MEYDRRNRGRTLFEQEKLDGEFRLYVDDDMMGIRELQDVSPFGIGLKVDTDIAHGKLIRIRYRHESIDIEVTGTVVWSLSEEPETAGMSHGCRIGVYFQDADMGPNVEFFNAITG